MSFTLEQLEAVERAIATGVTSVMYDGERVEYRSLSELIELRSRMRQELGLSTGFGRRYAVFNPGT